MKILSESIKQNKKPALIFRASMLGALVTLILIFTFCDLGASNAFYGGETAFGKIFSYTFFVVGFMPAIFVDTVVFACAFCMVKKLPLKILFGFLVYSTLFGAAYTIFESFPDAASGIKYGVCGGFATLGIFPVLFFMKKLSEENIKKLFYIFFIGAIMALLAFAFVGALQYTWGRNRYYGVIGELGLTYGPWYKPTGITSAREFRSFPSMHSSSAASFCMLIVLGWQFDFKRKTKIILNTVAILMMLCVPLSRVVMGWHYFTDTLFALLLSYAAAEIALFIGDRIYKRASKGTAG